MIEWLIPAIIATTSAISGAVKNRSDNKKYNELTEKNKRLNAYAAFTGRHAGADPEKPSAFRSIVGGAISGAKTGMDISSGIQGIQNSGKMMNLYEQLLGSQGGGMGLGGAAPSRMMPKMNDYFNGVRNFNG